MLPLDARGCASQSLTTVSVPSWQRVRAANLLAANGSAWVEHFRRHNSGTYNNQVRRRWRRLAPCSRRLASRRKHAPRCSALCPC